MISNGYENTRQGWGMPERRQQQAHVIGVLSSFHCRVAEDWFGTTHVAEKSRLETELGEFRRTRHITQLSASFIARIVQIPNSKFQIRTCAEASCWFTSESLAKALITVLDFPIETHSLRNTSHLRRLLASKACLVYQLVSSTHLLAAAIGNR